MVELGHHATCLQPEQQPCGAVLRTAQQLERVEPCPRQVDPSVRQVFLACRRTGSHSWLEPYWSAARHLDVRDQEVRRGFYTVGQMNSRSCCLSPGSVPRPSLITPLRTGQARRLKKS